MVCVCFPLNDCEITKTYAFARYGAQKNSYFFIFFNRYGGKYISKWRIML